MKVFLQNFKSSIQRFSLYIKKHNLLVRYKERRKGISRTIFAWALVGLTGISFTYALETTEIPGSVALFYQSIFILVFLLLKCLFNDGLSALKVIEKASFDPQHLTVLQRRWSIFIRGSLGIIAGASFEFSKAFSSIVDNSTMFGADALVVALIMRFVLKEKLGIRWVWVFIAFVGILTIFYADFQSLNWRNSVSGAFLGAFSTVCFAIVFLMTSYMVHHDKPITIAFYQGVAAVVYACLYLGGSFLYLLLTDNGSQVLEYLYFFHPSNLSNLPLVLLMLGGVAYGWALPLFFESFYYTETLILATLGYFLGPILSVYEVLFYGRSQTTWINKWSILLVTLGTGGLLWYEKMSKKRDGLFIVPEEESPQENLYSIVSDYNTRIVDKFYYLSHMYEYERVLYLFSDLINGSQMKQISIKQNKVEFSTDDPRITFEDDISIRCPAFEIINFGSFEPEVKKFLQRALKDGDTIFDIGAGIGWYSLNFASSYKLSTIYAFEPVKHMFELLLSNIKKNKLENIVPLNCGISKHPGKFIFHYVKNQHEYLKNILQPEDIESEVKGLGEIIDQFALYKIDFIKQELKFTEEPFFIGNEKIIDSYFPMIMFNLREYWDEDLLKNFHERVLVLENLGYEKVIFTETPGGKRSEAKHYFYFHPIKHPNIKEISCEFLVIN